MPKIKTNSGAKKRFALTGTDKITMRSFIIYLNFVSLLYRNRKNQEKTCFQKSHFD